MIFCENHYTNISFLYCYIEKEITNEVAGFYQGRFSITIVGKLYLNKEKLADKFYDEVLLGLFNF